jgi:probable addiction module antidote protein
MKEKVTFARWDAAGYLETEEDIVAYLDCALEENDAEFLLSAIGDIARSKGMTKLARELQMDRKGLYKAFALSGNPAFLTVVKVLDNLGFRLCVRQKKSAFM